MHTCLAASFVVLAAMVAGSVGPSAARQPASGGLLATVDHLVYATPDLDATISDVEALLGVRATYGGRHPGRGTRNALLALSENSYLEIVGPDPEQAHVSGPRWLGIDDLSAARLVTWAVKCANIETVAESAARAGVALGSVTSGSRQTTDGTVLRWRLTDPGAMVEDGLIPFLIDWGASRHPALSSPRGPTLLSLRAEHSEAERVERAASVLGLELPVARASQARLIARLQTERGEVDLY